jgi:predicted nucleotidyltransferase
MLNIDQRFLLLAITGSQAYGIAIEGGSDLDFKGDCIEYLQPAEELKTLLQEKIDYKQIFLNHRFPEDAQRPIQEYTNASADFMRLTFASRQYLAAKKDWNSYQTWQKNRNPKRQA